MKWILAAVALVAVVAILAAIQWRSGSRVVKPARSEPIRPLTTTVLAVEGMT